VSTKTSKCTLKIITQNFKILENKRQKFLQFTRTISFSHPVLGEIRDSIDHCIAFYRKDGTLKWNPPVSYIPSFGMKKQLHAMSTPLYNLVCESLLKSGMLSNIEVPLDYNIPKEGESFIDISTE